MKRISLTLFLLILVACGGSSGGGGNGASNLPGTIQLGNTSYDVTEGAVVNILVTRSGGSSGAVSVDYATADGTAEAGTDYQGMSGTLNYADGLSGNQTISIPITDDGAAEVAEAFTVTLSNVSGATLGARSSATVNIVNDSAALPITDGNAQDITVTVLEAITSTVDIVDFLDVIGLPVTASVKPAVANAIVMAVSTETIFCDTGEATVTWDDVDNNFVISTGDTFDVLFAMCFDADAQTTLDGPMSLTNLVVTGDPFNQIAPWGLALTFGFNDLTGTDSAGSVIISGDLDLAFNSEENVVVDLSLGTVSLTAQQNGISETLSGYTLAETLDLNTLTQVIRTSGTFASTLLEGAVTFETLQDFVIVLDDNPSAGLLLVSDSSSSVLITVLDNISVQLDIDIDLDGTIDETIVVTWADLDID